MEVLLDASWIVLGAIALALIFDFINGFHDTANAVATVIYSKALTPRLAIGMSAAFNFIGAVTVGTTVALFITKLIPMNAVSIELIMSALLAGVVWNLGTWYFCLPVSSSHCLLGSLIGAGIAAVGWSGMSHGPIYTALTALIVSPLIGFALAFAVAFLVKRATRPQVGIADAQPAPASRHTLRWLQILSSASVSYSHGANDGQKTMGVILLILVTQLGSHGFTASHVPLWVVISAASFIGLGTAIGGWRIIRTVGERLSTKPIDVTHGCSAEFTTAATVFGASYIGVPVSTTHVLNSSVVGATYGLHGSGHADWGMLKKIGLAWLLTLPVTAGLAALIYVCIA